MSSNSTEWWRHAVIYQVYPRSFADSTGNGMGDLPGITAHLPYLRDLGVDAVWVSPFYPSPQKDAGYDVEDYCGVYPIFGTLADADRLIARAHEVGLRIIVDVVPNHTSDQHVWFRQALASPVGSPERDRYHFREPDPEHPESAPNNWESNFGGAAWSKHDDDPYGQWYLHLFDSSQPDLNWENPQVRADFDDILRFWLDRGVDGFRVDVAHGLMKAPGLPDATGSTHPDRHLTPIGDATMASSATPYWDQDGVHEIYRRWRRIVDSYGSGDTQRIMVAEAWVEPIDRIARYVRPDEHHQAFNFAFIDTRWDAAALRSVITQSYEVNDAVGAPTTWVLSNHDVIRHATRLALAPEEAVTQLAGPVHEPDRRTGLNRARAASTLMLGLPGSAYLYQGEELGLPEVLDIPDHLRQDPTFYRTRMNSGSSSPELGRDGCRVPLPWLSEAPSYGFSPPETEGAGTHSPASPWLPQPAIFGDLAVDRQTGDPSSTMELYRRLLRLRRTLGIAGGKAKVIDPVDGDGSDSWDRSDVLVVEVTTKASTGTSTRTSTEASTVLVCTNIGTKHWNIPAGHGVLIASTPGVDDRLPPDCTVWLARLDSAAE